MHQILNKRNNSLPPGPNPEEGASRELDYIETTAALEKMMSSNSLNKINTDVLYKMTA